MKYIQHVFSLNRDKKYNLVSCDISHCHFRLFISDTALLQDFNCNPS